TVDRNHHRHRRALRSKTLGASANANFVELFILHGHLFFREITCRSCGRCGLSGMSVLLSVVKLQSRTVHPGTRRISAKCSPTLSDLVNAHGHLGRVLCMGLFFEFGGHPCRARAQKIPAAKVARVVGSAATQTATIRTGRAWEGDQTF